MQMQDRVGQQFGNYRLIRRIGQGGSAEVYLAENILLRNLRYAIKVMTGTSLSKDKQGEFLYEARTIADLQHLNTHIVQIYDVGIQTSFEDEERGIPYLVMEYASQGTLRSLYHHNKPVPLERIVFYAKQVAEALQCAHDQTPPIVHRDIKPENMLLRNLDHVLLSDFGIAITGQTSPLAATKDPEIFGTAAYIAPEQLSGHTRRASDQYSLAIVVYEWLCGSRPFDGTDREICFKQLKMEPPPLYPAYPHITGEIQAVVMRALKKNPEERYPTVLAFVQALEEAVQSALHPHQSIQNQLMLQPIENSMDHQPRFQVGVPAMYELPHDDVQVQSPAKPEELQTMPKKLPEPQVELPVLHKELSGFQAGSPSIHEELPHVDVEPLAVPAELQIVQMGMPAPQAEPAPPQSDRSPGASWYYDSLDTEPVAYMQTQQALPFRASAAAPTTRSLKRVQVFFAFSPQFASDYRHSFFRGGGIFLNVVSAIIVGWLLHTVYLPLAGLLFSLLMFMLCVCAVDEILALFFGTLVALYWGVVGWVIGSYAVPLLHLQGLSPFIVGLIFFIVSFGSHYWYVRRKNP